MSQESTPQHTNTPFEDLLGERAGEHVAPARPWPLTPFIAVGTIPPRALHRLRRVISDPSRSHETGQHLETRSMPPKELHAALTPEARLLRRAGTGRHAAR